MVHPKKIAQTTSAALGAALPVNSSLSPSDHPLPDTYSTRTRTRGGTVSVANDGTYISSIGSDYQPMATGTGGEGSESQYSTTSQSQAEAVAPKGETEKKQSPKT